MTLTLAEMNARADAAHEKRMAAARAEAEKALAKPLFTPSRKRETAGSLVGKLDLSDVKEGEIVQFPVVRLKSGKERAIVTIRQAAHGFVRVMTVPDLSDGPQAMPCIVTLTGKEPVIGYLRPAVL